MPIQKLARISLVKATIFYLSIQCALTRCVYQINNIFAAIVKLYPLLKSSSQRYFRRLKH